MPLRDALEPAGEEGNVHALRAHDAKASLLPGLADVGPTNHMILLPVIVSRPIEHYFCRILAFPITSMKVSPQNTSRGGLRPNQQYKIHVNP